jgi:hypothetical protein
MVPEVDNKTTPRNVPEDNDTSWTELYCSLTF